MNIRKAVNMVKNDIGKACCTGGKFDLEEFNREYDDNNIYEFISTDTYLYIRELSYELPLSKKDYYKSLAYEYSYDEAKLEILMDMIEYAVYGIKKTKKEIIDEI